MKQVALTRRRNGDLDGKKMRIYCKLASYLSLQRRLPQGNGAVVRLKLWRIPCSSDNELEADGHATVDAVGQHKVKHVDSSSLFTNQYLTKEAPDQCPRAHCLCLLHSAVKGL